MDPKCSWCGLPMRKEPLALAWVHAGTGSMLCEPGAEKVTPQLPRHGTRSYLQRLDPHTIEHTIEVFEAVCNAGTSPGHNLRVMIVHQLTELKRLKSQP